VLVLLAAPTVTPFEKLLFLGMFPPVNIMAGGFTLLACIFSLLVAFLLFEFNSSSEEFLGRPDLPSEP